MEILNDELIKSFSILVQAVHLAYNKGSFSMAEVHQIVEAIEVTKKYVPIELLEDKK